MKKNGDLCSLVEELNFMDFDWKKVNSEDNLKVNNNSYLMSIS